MTHDELLAKIKQVGPRVQIHVALYRVVELCDFLDKKGRCCVPVTEVIQAIEKELQ